MNSHLPLTSSNSSLRLSGQKLLLLLLVFLTGTLTMEAQTPRVAFVGATRTSSPDGFSFVAGEAIAGGSTIYFTDEEWRSACGAFHFDNDCEEIDDGEPYMIYTAPAGGLVAGEVVFVSETGTNTFTVTGGGGTFEVMGNGGFSFSSSDVIFAFETSNTADPLDNVSDIYAALNFDNVFDGSVLIGDDPRDDYPNAVVTIMGASDGEFDPSLRGNPADAAALMNLDNWNIENPAANLALSTVPFTGGIDLSPTIMIVCPDLGTVTTTPAGTVCLNNTFDVSVSGLSNMASATNNDTDYGIRFVAFTSATADPYTGGTDLGTVAFGSLTGGGTTATFTGASLATAGTYTVYAVLSPVPADDACRPSAVPATLTVNALPSVTFTAPADLCIDAGVQAGLSGGSPTGGAYSGTGVTDDGNGTTYIFDPAAAGAGIHNINYTFTNANGCTGSASDDTEVFPLPTITFTAPADLCVDAGVQAGLSGGSPTGGVYSGAGITDDGNGTTYSFDPAAAGVGIHNINYTFTDANGCTGSASDDTEVFALPTVIFSTGDLMVQEDAGVQSGLSGGMPTGGVYSGNGVTDDGNGMTYSFDPAVAGVGENVITYTFSDANGCGGEQGAIITVTPVIVPGDLCAEAIDISAQFGGPFNEPQTTDMFNNTNFTTGADDPLAGFECFYGGDLLQNSGWFSFTGDGNTYQVRNTVCTGPGGIDLQAVVYSGSCGDLTMVACNDDDPAGGFAFFMEFDTEEGVEYLILVDGFNGTEGDFCIEVTNVTEPLPGDLCEDAINIANLFGQAEMMPQLSELYNNEGYSVSGNDPTSTLCGIGFTEASPMWFTFTGDGNRYTIDNANSSIGLVAVIYTGECEALTEIDCGFDSVNPVFDLQTEEGVEYLLIVSNNQLGATGTFNLEVTNQGSVGVTNIQETAIRLYPNPTSGFFQLDGVDAARVMVFDQLGRQVARFDQPRQQMDIQALPAGVYTLRIEDTDGQFYSARVVKE